MSRQSDTISLDFKLIKNDIEERYPDYKVVVLTKKLNKNISSAIRYYFHIYKQMYHLATSKVCLADTYIIPISVLKHKKDLVIIQLCHGIGNIKKFGYQTLKNESGKGELISKLMNMHGNYDYLISTSKATSKFYAKAFNMNEKQMINIGTPKIDYILNINKQEEKVLKRYPHIKDKPIILYVSTFRTYEDDYLKKFIENAPLDNYNVIIHIHPVAYKYHPDIEKYVSDERIYRCKDIPTVDLLSVADIVITDYSSFVFESAILGKPTYLYVSDYDKYIKKNGLNVDIFKELPGCVYKDARSLFKKIEKNDYDFKTIKKFKNKYIEYSKGDSTQQVVDFMIDKTI
jgi:CDP-ribitol ribitolphosphotransferase